KTFLEDCFDALINLITRPFNIELRLSTNRQSLDKLRKIAFMRAANQLFPKAERTGNFRGAGDQGDDSMHIRPKSDVAGEIKPNPRSSAASLRFLFLPRVEQDRLAGLSGEPLGRRLIRS